MKRKILFLFLIAIVFEFGCSPSSNPALDVQPNEGGGAQDVVDAQDTADAFDTSEVTNKDTTSDIEDTKPAPHDIEDTSPLDVSHDTQQDIPGDIVPYDVEHDVPQDYNEPDINFGDSDVHLIDTGTADVNEQSQTLLYRVSSLHIKEPPLSYCPQGNNAGNCVEITGMVNNMIDNKINGNDGKYMDILVKFFFNPPDNTLEIGNGMCVRDNSNIITGCSYLPTQKPISYDNVEFKQSGMCWQDPQVNAVCLNTPAKDGDVDLSQLGFVIPLKQIQVAANFNGPDAFDINTELDGYLKGFLTQAEAKAIHIKNQYFDGTLEQLLPENKMTKLNGVSGWWFLFSFNAKRVPVILK